MRNRFQTLLGLIVVLVGTAVAYAAAIIGAWLVRLVARSSGVSAVEARERVLAACGCTAVARLLCCCCTGRGRAQLRDDGDADADQRARDVSESGDGVSLARRGGDDDMRLAFLDRHTEALSRRGSGAAGARTGASAMSGAPRDARGGATAATAARYAGVMTDTMWSADGEGGAAAAHASAAGTARPAGAGGSRWHAAVQEGAAAIAGAVEVVCAFVCIALVGFVAAGVALP